MRVRAIEHGEGLPSEGKILHYSIELEKLVPDKATRQRMESDFTRGYGAWIVKDGKHLNLFVPERGT